MDISCSAQVCPVILNATCVFYEGPTLVYTGIVTDDNLQTALQKIDAKFEDAGLGYIFNNGVIQTSPGLPVGLGGALVQDTVIDGAGYTLTIDGSLFASAFKTIGGTSSDFVKGDGTLDNTSYQPAGNYITSLSGDGTATGPGGVVFTLATVNGNPGTYGSGVRIPVVTANAKGLITNITSVPITLPSGSLSFVGDVTGSGVTGSPVTLTLQPVNSNIYGSNTFLKFAVNAKGLVTSATPVTALDIEGTLGFTPVPETRTLTINGTSYDLSADRIWTITNGTSGINGTSGVNGTSGRNGTSGTSGPAGTSGSSGSSGSSGIDGYNGSSGTSGRAGSSGTSGLGSPGTSGTSGVGSPGTSGTSGSSGLSPAIENLITVGLPGSIGVDFNSVKAAVDSISGATSTNTYTVRVYPGLYIEDTITMKSWVSVKGDTHTTTIIQASSTANSVFIMADQSMVIDLQIQGSTDTGVAAIVYSSPTTPQTNAIAYAENIRFGANYTHAKVVGTAGGNCILQCSNVKYGGYPFTLGFYVTNDGSGIGRMQLRNVTSTNGGITTTTGLIFAKSDQPGCTFIVNGCLLTKASGAAAGTGFWVENGGSLRLTAVNFQRWATAIYAPNTGSAPSIFGTALNFENNTKDVVVEHPTATGKFEGTDAFLKTEVPIDAPIYEVNVDPRIITVAKKGGDFTSVKAAADWITGSTVNNRFVIKVGPGEFIENEIDLSFKPYVSVVGSDIQGTQITAAGTNHNIFKLGNANEVSFLTVSGAGTGYAGFSCSDINGFALIHKVSMYNCDYGIKVYSSSVSTPTTFYGEYVDINGTFSYGVYVESISSALAIANMENYWLFPTASSSQVGNYATGAGALMNIYSSTFEGDSGVGSIGILLADGATLESTGLDLQGFDIGVKVLNLGAAPLFRIVGSMIHTCVTWDFLVEHPTAQGRMQGISSHPQISNASDNFFWNFLDDVDGENDITRKLSVTFADGTHTDASTLLFNGSPMGVMEGGVITVSSGLTITASTGFGYLEDTITPEIYKRIDWTASNLLLTANTDNYIYINDIGILSASGTQPSSISNIILGRVVTGSASVILIDQTPFDAAHMSNKLSEFNRNALGAVYASGSAVAEDATPFKLDVGSGDYYFSENNFLPSGGNAISFTQYYRNGGTGWTTTVTDTVNHTNYDNGTGTLASLTAGYFTKHTLYVVGEGVDEQYFLVLGQAQYSSLVTAEGAALPLPPTYFTDGVVTIASIYIQQGAANILQIEDIRPVIGFKASGVSATAVHGNLLGLAADDHTQYLLVDGTREMSNDLGLGGNDLYNTLNITASGLTDTNSLKVSGITNDELQTRFVVTDSVGNVYYKTTGVSGTSGSSGLTGTSGVSGTSGINGTAGTSGINGTSGTTGTSGINGTSGTTGTSGVNGTSGTSGANGTSGTTGTSGINGTSGTSGTRGTSGSSGSSGTSGANGTSGINGTSGTTGTSGANGTAGTSGLQGTSGTSGLQGTSGTTGTSGLTGTAGTSGLTGTSGTSGNNGTSGVNGTSGTSGANGTSGTSGANGTSGVNGTSGTSGLNGTSGTTGTSGVSGTSGTSGANGTSGTSGLQGTSGTSGTSGANGTSGTSGLQGTSGTSGVQGTSGTSGTSGLQGTSGTSGLQGTSGTSGTSGLQGTSGTSGANGTSGVNGTSGTSGLNGTSGTSGVNGTSGTTGTSGINGTSGTAGTSGLQGTSGTSGINGTSGTTGTSGANGTSGTSGLNGTSGTTGTSGVSGSSGTSGNSGTSGTSGINGTAGTSGISGVNTINISAGAVSQDLSAVVFSNGGGVSFGLNAGTITASAPGGGAANTYTALSYNNRQLGASTNTVPGQNSVWLAPFYIGNNISASTGLHMVSITGSVTSNQTNTVGLTWNAALYQVTGTNQSRYDTIFSTTLGFTFWNSGTASVSFSYNGGSGSSAGSNLMTASIYGNRHLTFNIGSTFAPGDYAWGFRQSTASTGNSSVMRSFNAVMDNPLPLPQGLFLAATNASIGYVEAGIYSATSAAMPVSFLASQIVQTNNVVPYFKMGAI